MTNQFKTKADLHLARKIWHFAGVMLIVVLFNSLTRMHALLLLIFFTVLFVSIDVTRQSSSKLNKFAVKLMSPFIRESERNSIAGTTYLLTAALLVIFFFPPKVATLALLFLAIGDPIASLFGILFGRDKLVNNKTLQGSIAAFIFCFLISLTYYFYYNIMTERLLIVALLSGLIGALAELIPIGKIDDNFTLPILSSSLLWAVFYFFGGFI